MLADGGWRSQEKRDQKSAEITKNGEGIMADGEFAISYNFFAIAAKRPSGRRNA